MKRERLEHRVQVAGNLAYREKDRVGRVHRGTRGIKCQRVRYGRGGTRRDWRHRLGVRAMQGKKVQSHWTTEQR